MTAPWRLKHPIVLVHGLGAKHRYGPVEYFWGLPERLRADGNRVAIANLTSWHTLEHRSQELRAQLEALLPGERVILIGHSMGGIDCRLLASQPDMAGRVAAVVTIGTPNRGCMLADIALGLVPQTAFSKLDELVDWLGVSNRGFQQLSRKYMEGVFNRQFADAPGVAYFSATTVIREPARRNSLPVFWLTHPILRDHEGENDGMVSLDSAKWGTHIVTEHGDHYAQIGQMLGFTRGLDHIRFFDRIFRRLKKEGF